jgi:hypothetical protein
MGVVSITYQCGCSGQHQIVCNQPTNRDKETIRKKERGLCPDCYREKLETEFMAKWGRLPSVQATSEAQAAFATRVLMTLLGSGRVRPRFVELIMAAPDLPVRVLLDTYTTDDRRDPPEWSSAISWQEDILGRAYPDHWAKFIDACPPSETAEGMAAARKQAREKMRMDLAKAISASWGADKAPKG